MGKGKSGEAKFYDVAHNSVRIFVFLYIAVLGAYLVGFTELHELISLLGAALLFGASLFAAVVDELD